MTAIYALENRNTCETGGLESEDERLEVSRAYWNKCADSIESYCSADGYADSLIQLLELQDGDSVLDMGCAVGILALPLARSGHRVVACDFASRMIDKLDESVAVMCGRVDTKVMAWQDDWEAFGLGENAVDVAIASRSIGMNDLDMTLLKLDCVASRNAAVTLSAGVAPVFDPFAMAYLGRQVPRPRQLQDALRVLFEMGRFPTLSYIPCEKPMRFKTVEEVYAELRRMTGEEPFTEREQGLFDQYAAEHLKQVKNEGGIEFRLDYRLLVPWAFVKWDTRGKL